LKKPPGAGFQGREGEENHENPKRRKPEGGEKRLLKNLNSTLLVTNVSSARDPTAPLFLSSFGFSSFLVFVIELSGAHKPAKKPAIKSDDASTSAPSIARRYSSTLRV